MLLKTCITILTIQINFYSLVPKFPNIPLCYFPVLFINNGNQITVNVLILKTIDLNSKSFFDVF